jgi:hypothetical protein
VCCDVLMERSHANSQIGSGFVLSKAKKSFLISIFIL